MSDSIEAKIETKFGPMIMWVLDRYNISLRSERDHDLTINGSKWPVTLHLRDYNDGMGFVPLRRQGSENMPSSVDYQWISSSRWSDKKRTWEDITSAARLKLEAMIPEVVNAWVLANPESLAEAQRNSIHSQIDRADGEIAELEAKIAEQRAKKLELMGQLVSPEFKYVGAEQARLV